MGDSLKRVFKSMAVIGLYLSASVQAQEIKVRYFDRADVEAMENCFYRQTTGYSGLSKYDPSDAEYLLFFIAAEMKWKLKPEHLAAFHRMEKTARDNQQKELLGTMEGPEKDVGQFEWEDLSVEHENQLLSDFSNKVFNHPLESSQLNPWRREFDAILESFSLMDESGDRVTFIQFYQEYVEADGVREICRTTSPFRGRYFENKESYLQFEAVERERLKNYLQGFVHLLNPRAAILPIIRKYLKT